MNYACTQNKGWGEELPKQKERFRQGFHYHLTALCLITEPFEGRPRIGKFECVYASQVSGDTISLVGEKAKKTGARENRRHFHALELQPKLAKCRRILFSL